jgi:phage-related protein
MQDEDKKKHYALTNTNNVNIRYGSSYKQLLGEKTNRTSVYAEIVWTPRHGAKNVKRHNRTTQTTENYLKPSFTLTREDFISFKLVLSAFVVSYDNKISLIKT